jgi:CRP/FNR family transcriptional regulator
MKKYLYLKQSKLFTNVSDTNIKKLSEISVIKSFDKNFLIANEGDSVKGIYIVGTGKIKVYQISDEGQIFINKIADLGEAIAEVVIFQDNPKFPAYVETIERSEILYIPLNKLLNLLSNNNELYLNFLKLYSNIILNFKSKMENIVLDDLYKRLMKFFESQIKQNKSNIINLDISKQNLAALMGTIPATISRVLKKLEKSGNIKIQGKKIILNKNLT